MTLSPEDRLYERAKTGLRSFVAKDPIDANLAIVLSSAWLFYKAEKGINPKVQSFGDALVFVSTCLSVGYADVFARTEEGKLIASALMTVGPALSGALLEAPEAERRAEEAARTAQLETSIATQQAMLAKLEEIARSLSTERPS
jgi:hypothetical protein